MGFLSELGITGQDLSLGAIVALVILAVIFGQLIPKRTHEREISLLKEALDVTRASNVQLLDQQAKFAELTLAAYKTVPRED
jgi:hypothetical protein